MPRIVCICLSHWPVTRLRRAGLAPEGGPMAVAAEGPGGLRLVALDPEALALGLRPGEPLGRVRARIGVPLRVHPADPAADRDSLLRLCRWAGGYAPLVAPFGPAEATDGLYIDVAGASHLRGGEAKLVDDLAARLARGNIPARIALADTPGGAFALARHGGADRIVVPPGGAAEALRGLPVEALRLDPGAVAGLKRLGLRGIGALDALPRGPLARRFGEALLLRLDQALARRPEPLAPLTEAADHAAARGFLDPIGRQSDIVRTARDLMADLAPRLERDGLGACALRLALHRVDGAVRTLDLGLSRPERCPERVAALVSLRLDRLGSGLDAGFGFETVALAVTVTGAMPARQTDLGANSGGDGVGGDGVGFLADALAQRLGRALLRLEPRASHLPERGERGVLWVAGEGPGSSADQGIGRLRARLPPPSEGEGGPRRGSGEGSDVSGCSVTLMKAGAPSCTVAPLSPPAAQGTLPRRGGREMRGSDSSLASPWPDHLPPRPLVLFPRGEAACDVLSTVPEGPPRRFRWRAQIHRVAHVEGPERIAAEWWREPGEPRDYYRVECEAGHRLWLYRDGPHAPDRPAAWYVHGLFA
ncbi:DNA polymerase Y family protein [Methylobacterium sp. J-030]|uniref:DNA polymerase Y family protein n=1 Tax=Methylobacterium sp. J-030 TaxID=2836627 RepID=UPI001FBB048E|nr:DNA polymerase Y family protein [Methylobacterium sp. J-030]MCJ2072263.1 DNA polymerase Y family protein [Methylobacterium sp. J-030]